jgi:tetratricopeptide (TPR) repeat protein
MALDILGMWNFGDPAGTEQKFREALKTAKGDDALILQTQIARTYGLRKNIDESRRILKEVEAQLGSAGVESNVRYWLEWGRTLSSAVHAKETQTAEVRAQALAAFDRAFKLADKAGLGYLAVDALHMRSFAEPDQAKILELDLNTLAYMEASTDPEAKKWEGSMRNNVGWALHKVGRLEESLAQFKLALAARERQGDPQRIRVAHWMIAWTLRAMKRTDEALAIQLRLEKEWDEAKKPDPYVYEELTALYKEKGDAAKATHYQAKFDAAKGK